MTSSFIQKLVRKWPDGTVVSVDNAFDVLYAPRAQPDSATPPKKTGPKPRPSAREQARAILSDNAAMPFNVQIASQASSERTKAIRGRGNL